LSEFDHITATRDLRRRSARAVFLNKAPQRLSQVSLTRPSLDVLIGSGESQ